MTITHTTEAWPHARHTQNRIAKAQRLVAAIDASELFSAKLDANVLAELGPKGWETLAAFVGEDAPSTVTVGIVLGIVAGRLEEAN